MSLRLEDIERIKQLQYRYYRSADTGDLVEVARCFTTKASVAWIGGSYRVELTGREAIVGALRAMLHAELAIIHTAHHPEITVHSAEAAEGIWYQTDWTLHLKNKTVTQGACLARMTYQREEGVWRIAHYGYTRIYEQVEPLDQLPQITAHALGTPHA